MNRQYQQPYRKQLYRSRLRGLEARFWSKNDHFGGDGKDKLQVFRANRKTIEGYARQKCLGGRTEPDGSVLIRTLDLLR